jgi:cathepsin C
MKYGCGVAVAMLFTLLGQATADIPVHCLHKHIRGEWLFHMGHPNQDKEKIKCSKGVTEGDYATKSNNFGLGSPSFPVMTQLKVQLDAPNKASAVMDGKHVTGTWTMIYDEGFEVTLGGQKFFAFSKFSSDNAEKNAKAQHDKYGFVKENPGETEYSYCDQTYPGWYHPELDMDQAKWGCYYGVKTTKVPVQKYRKFGSHTTRIPAAKLFDRMADRKAALVQYINDAKTTWTAKHYDMDFSKMGTKLRHYKLLPEDREEQQLWASEIQVDTSDIPKAWDWGKVGKKNFAGPVINQGACGSCYAIAVSEMLGARMSILKNENFMPMSASPSLRCSFYTQGCQGGFPFLAAKYAQDFGSSKISDIPYTGSDGKCPLKSKKQIAGRATGYQYIGGYYGASSEKAMRRELFDHGPIVVGFEATPDLQAYSDGIFHTKYKYPDQDHFERVNHAVLITGFGEENGMKYWKVKNSWGRDWGEKGFFRMQRGVDNLNIEHMSVAVYPTLGNNINKPHKAMKMDSSSVGHKLLAELSSVQELDDTEHQHEDVDELVPESY